MAAVVENAGLNPLSEIGCYSGGIQGRVGGVPAADTGIVGMIGRYLFHGYSTSPGPKKKKSASYLVISKIIIMTMFLFQVAPVKF